MHCVWVLDGWSKVVKGVYGGVGGTESSGDEIEIDGIGSVPFDERNYSREELVFIEKRKWHHLRIFTYQASYLPHHSVSQLPKLQAQHICITHIHHRAHICRWNGVAAPA